MNRLRRILGGVVRAARWIVKMERVAKETRERERCDECGAGFCLGVSWCPVQERPE